MSQHRRLIRKFQRQRLIAAIVLWLMACAAAAAVFSPPGLATYFWKIDLSFLLQPLLVFFILRLLAQVFSILSPVTGELAACLLNGAALALAGFFFFSRAELLARISWLAGRQSFLEDLTYLPGFFLMAVSGYTLVRASVPLRYLLKTGVLSPLLSAMGWILVGTGLWCSFAVFSHSWPDAGGIGAVFFWAAAVLAVTRLAWYGLDSSRLVIADASRWLTARPGEKFLAGGLAAAYFIFIRQFLFAHISTAYLVEWLLFCLLSWRILESIRQALERRYVAPLKESGWRSHVQKEEDLPDENFNKLIDIQENFVEGGSRAEILQYLRQLLVRNGQGDEEAVRLLQPIIEHSDRKIPWWAFAFLRRRYLRRNRLERQKSLDQTIKGLAAIGTPGM